ncbi:helix-turn-helix domain-containing protein [Deinococcus lacus]|uniref:Helix-turn-helix domain-containing protein n=1 Tax=Deinococcus lacus TaxID=392561 RepID=A0ABW1YD94_9DEIO
MTLQLNLGRYLREHDISAYRLVQEVKGEVAPNTVYDLARNPAQRVNLRVVAKILDALSRVRGEKVSVIEVLDEIEEIEEQEAAPTALPTLEQLLAQVPQQDPVTFKKFSYDRSRQPISIGADGPSIVDLISEGRGR